MASYLTALRSHLLLAVLVFLATVGASVAFLQVRTKEYVATAEVLVTPLPSEQQNLLSLPLVTETPDATRISQTAAALLRSNEAATRVARKLGRGWTRQRVLERVQIEPRGESNVIAITATAEGAEQAARVANLYTQEALDARRRQLEDVLASRISRLQARLDVGGPSSEAADIGQRLAALRAIADIGDPTLSIAQAAAVPTSSSSPGPALVGGAAVFAGLVLGLGAALLASRLDRRLREEEELVSLFPLPILARLPESSRATARARAAEEFRTLLAELDALRGASQVVLLTSATGGDGKTNSAIQLARAAREANRRVIYLDFDLRRPLSSRGRGGLEPEQLLGPDSEAADAPRLQAGRPLEESLIAAAHDRDLSLALPQRSGDSADLTALTRSLPRLIAEARELADLVLVDTSPLGEVGDALRLLDSVDRVLIVAHLGVTRRSAFESMRDLLLRAGRTPEGFLVVGSSIGTPDAAYQRELFSPQPFS